MNHSAHHTTAADHPASHREADNGDHTHGPTTTEGPPHALSPARSTTTVTAPHGRRPPDPTGTSARRQAWHTYLTLRTEVLPAITDHPLDSYPVIAAMADLAQRIRRHAPHWGLRGTHLVLLTEAAMRRRAAGDFTALAMLLHLVARWLFDLSRTRPRWF